MIITNEIPPKAIPSGMGVASEAPGGSEKKLPESWKDSLACLISSRLAIIQAESKDVASSGVKKAALAVLAALCALFTWALILVGAIGAISDAISWTWYQIAFVAAGLHLLVALIAVLGLRAKSAPSFPVTRAEFEKDREWLNQLNKKPE